MYNLELTYEFNIVNGPLESVYLLLLLLLLLFLLLGLKLLHLLHLQCLHLLLLELFPDGHFFFCH